MSKETFDATVELADLIHASIDELHLDCAEPELAHGDPLCWVLAEDVVAAGYRKPQVGMTHA